MVATLRGLAFDALVRGDGKPPSALTGNNNNERNIPVSKTDYSSAFDLMVDGNSDAVTMGVTSQVKGARTKYANFQAVIKQFGPKGQDSISMDRGLMGVAWEALRDEAERWQIAVITPEVTKAYQDLVKSAVKGTNASGAEVLGHVNKGKFKALPGFYAWLTPSDPQVKRIGFLSGAKMAELDRLIAKGVDPKDVHFMYLHTLEKYQAVKAAADSFKAKFDAI